MAEIENSLFYSDASSSDSEDGRHDTVSSPVHKKRKMIPKKSSTPLPPKPPPPPKRRTYTLKDYNQHMLQWDILNEWSDMVKGEKVEGEEEKLEVPLPDRHESIEEYVSVWAPLHIKETRAQLLTEVIANWEKGGVGRCVMDVLVKVVKVDLEEDCLNVSLTPSSSSTVEVQSNDFLLLSDLASIKSASKGQRIDSSNEVKGIVAVITQYRKSWDGMIAQISRSYWKKVGKKEMYLMKIGNNVSALREFKALCQAHSTPLLDDILCKSPFSKQNENTPSISSMGLGYGFTDHVLKKFNKSQQNAIEAAASEYGKGGFTLVKGPPGTGKTTTLLSILNSLYIRQYHEYYEQIRLVLGLTNPTHDTIHRLDLLQAQKAKPRILVCAPSNVAVDNIVLKIMKEGFLDANGKRCNPGIVRVGARQSADVKAVNLEEMADLILNESVAKLEYFISSLKTELNTLEERIVKLKARVQALLAATPWDIPKNWEIRIHEESFEKTGRVYFVNHNTKSTTFQMPPEPRVDEESYPPTELPEYRLYVADIMRLVERYNVLTARLERYTLVQKSTMKRDLQDRIMTHILDEVHIVLTTLGTAGNRNFEDCDKFEVVVIDEAAQSVEPATLVALRLGSRHAVLVGDPQQLPATIFNVSGRNTKYDRSLFQRLEESGCPVHMLDTQYRMHASISEFPRRIFYDGNLLDGDNVKQDGYGGVLRKKIVQHFPFFQPFTLLDLNSSEDKSGTSRFNSAEAHLALHLYLTLDSKTNGTSSNPRVAIITPYTQQVNILQKVFYQHFGSQYTERVEINTVDSFQGKEANIVIFSCVRAAGSRGIGFLSDVRRMNVALTRAKFYLFVIARCKSILVNPYWRDLVAHARERRAILQIPMEDGRRCFPDLTRIQPLPVYDEDSDDGYISA